MAKIERIYNIPLRQKFQTAPKYRRAKKAVIEVKNFLSKHMKSANVKVGEQLNKLIWANGIKNPPHHVKVTAVKEEDGTVKAELFGKKYEEKKKQPKVEKTKMQEALEKAGLKTDSKPKEEKTTDSKEEEKPETKAPKTEDTKSAEPKKKETKPSTAPKKSE